MRDNYLQLPSPKEIEKILKTEADRDIPQENRHKHFVDFASLIELMKVYGVPVQVIEQNYSKKDILNPELLESMTNRLNRLVEEILISSPNLKQRERLDSSYGYLTKEDDPKTSDIIFVFGSNARYRTEKAIELYKNDIASKIMFSGGTPIYDNDNEPEIYSHIKYAKSEGIPEEAIIVEDKSISVPDNVKSSLNLLERDGIKHDKMILVMSPFAQRRGYAHFQKFSSGIDFYRVNSHSSEKYQPENWFEDKNATTVIMNEWAKMRFAKAINTI